MSQFATSIFIFSIKLISLVLLTMSTTLQVFFNSISPVVSSAKHGRHIGAMSLSVTASSSMLSHFWFPINNF